MRSLLLDKNVLSTISAWFTNLSAGWFGSIFILPILSDANPILLLTVNLPAAILTLWLAIFLARKGKNE